MKVSVLPWPKFDPWPIPSKWKAHQKEWYSILICITSKSIGQNGSNPLKKNMPVKFHQNSNNTARPSLPGYCKHRAELVRRSSPRPYRRRRGRPDQGGWTTCWIDFKGKTHRNQWICHGGKPQGVSTGTTLPCNSGTDRVDGYGWIWIDMDQNSIRVVQDGRVEPVTGAKVSTASKMFINPPCNPTAVMVPGFQGSVPVFGFGKQTRHHSQTQRLKPNRQCLGNNQENGDIH